MHVFINNTGRLLKFTSWGMCVWLVHTHSHTHTHRWMWHCICISETRFWHFSVLNMQYLCILFTNMAFFVFCEIFIKLCICIYTERRILNHIFFLWDYFIFLIVSLWYEYWWKVPLLISFGTCANVQCWFWLLCSHFQALNHSSITRWFFFSFRLIIIVKLRSMILMMSIGKQ